VVQRPTWLNGKKWKKSRSGGEWSPHLLRGTVREFSTVLAKCSLSERQQDESGENRFFMSIR